ncbi:hypothetical protein [Polystyrenella longa]|uniref:hypothetical protein n=1 Tax=Polystyrenella longa TaxID=2528007 RepID=UPI0011A83823|nr:hypothetical protein [Polystyrenella longa]
MYYDTKSGTLKFSPSDLTLFLESEFGSWMERWNCERRRGNSEVVDANGLPLGVDLRLIDCCEPDEQDEELKLIAEKGLEHEKAFLEQLRQQGYAIEELDSGTTDQATTLTTMQQGKDFVFQARLELDSFGGFADFLCRMRGESSLGEHHYEIWDTKLARSPKAYFVVQSLLRSSVVCLFGDAGAHAGSPP